MPEIPPQIVTALKKLEELGAKAAEVAKEGVEAAITEIGVVAEELKGAIDQYATKKFAKGIPATSTVLDNVIESKLAGELKALSYPSMQVKGTQLSIKGSLVGEKPGLKTRPTFEFQVQKIAGGKLPQITAVSGPGIEKPRLLSPEETRLVLDLVRRAQNSMALSAAVLVTTFGMGAAFWSIQRDKHKTAKAKPTGPG